MKSTPLQTRISLVAACLVIAIAVGCGDSAPSAPSSMSSGSVIAGSVTGASPAGLSVRVVGTDVSTAVGPKGTFELSGVPVGTAKLQFSGGDVNATAEVANVAADQLVTVEVQVSGTTAVITKEEREDRRKGPRVRIKKYTNNEDADFAPGPAIPLGSPVQWRYIVTNTGTVNLTNVIVVDDQGETVLCVGQNSLAPGATMTCSANDVVSQLGPYRNVGSVSAAFSNAGGSGQVADSDPSHYVGVAPVRIKKFTNGEDSDLPPGQSLLVGTPITWRYVVTNIGLTPLSAITVVDDQGETVLCVGPGTLAAGASMTCSATGTAAFGFYRNVGTVTATRTIGGISTTVTDSDASHYRGVLTLDDEEPKVTLCHKTGNGSFHLITVGAPAEPAHIKHGDGKPGGPVPGQAGKIFGPTCSIQ